MRIMFKLLVPVAFGLLSGCVVVPFGAPRAYVAGPRVAVLAPAPVVVVRPYYRYRW